MTDNEDTNRTQQYELDLIQLRVEFDKLVLRAQKRAVEDKLTQHYKKLIDEKVFEPFSEAAQPVLERVEQLSQMTDNIFDIKNGKCRWCFFTINYKSGFTMPEVEASMEEFCTKSKMMKECLYAYSIEQRTEEGDIEEGTHVHILFDKTRPPSKIIPIFNKFFFDKYVGTHAALDYRFINDQAEKLKYILGIKAKPKMPKVYQDRKLKDKYHMWWWHAQGSAMLDAIKEIVVTRSEEFESQMDNIV